MVINKGFQPKRETTNRLPPGQYTTTSFPVLSLGPTPKVDLNAWKLEARGLVTTPLSWTWEAFLKLPMVTLTKDIHCVTRWSKFDTKWKGVSVDEIIKRAKVSSQATHLIAHSFDGYSTNIPLVDIREGKAIIAIAYEDKDIPADHGGPARLLIPHLYFWKSAKWLKALEFVDQDQPGFWEVRGYHNHGNAWNEERYS